MTDCCPGVTPPADRGNPPGQPALRYRIGTWATFRRAMLDQLPRQPVPPDGPADGPRPLAALTTRADQDPTIALIDAFACVCDVLTFYQERILNEGYLPTAVESLSVTEIARGIGYEPAPGVAATVDLAFTVDPSHAGPLMVTTGQPVQSIPVEQGELQVTFETSADLEARAEWNAMTARPTRAHPIETGTTQLYLEGVNTRLAPGDPIVVVGQARAGAPVGATKVSERWDLRFVKAAEPDVAGVHTLVTLDRGLGVEEGTAPADTGVRVVTFRGRGGLFGCNAPDARIMSKPIRNNLELIVNGQWVDFKLADDRARTSISPRAVDLDREYPSIVQGGWICLQSSKQVELYRVAQVNPANRTEFSLSGRVTRVFVDVTEHLDDFGRRGTAVLLGSEQLALAEAPDLEAVSGFELQLAGRPEVPLPPGRVVLVTGTSVLTGEVEVVRTTVAAWAQSGLYPKLTLTDELPALERASVTIHANVVAATQGATVADEVIGAGDAGVTHQRFRLGHQPLTWVPAVPGGRASTLELRVDGLRWDPVATLHQAGPRDRVYTLGRDHDGGTIVGFGDGAHGARLPAGTENVRGTYRKGIGFEGEVGAGQLSLLPARPPGLQAVVNPAAATGAADPDAFEDTRRSAPLTVLTLDRLVSVQDYEDYAVAFPGVGKATAVELWNGRRGFVHLTVASASGGVFDEKSATIDALVASIAAVQDPAHHTLVSPHDQVTFAAALKVLVDGAYVADDVLAAVAGAITTAFSFSERRFGQPVTAAEVLETGHAVAGVVALDLDDLSRTDGRVGGIPGVVLPAAVATWDGTLMTPAELLLADPAAITVSLMDDT